MKTKHYRTSWLRTIGNFAYIFGVAFLIASFVTSLLPPKVAAAHHANVSGNASCQSNGTYSINWTISNWSDVNGPMTITSISRSIGVGVGTQVDVNGVSGSETVSNQSATITLTVSASWSNGNTSTNSGSVNLKGNCYPPATNTPVTPVNTATNTPTHTATNTPETPRETPTNTPTAPTEENYQLNLSHIACVEGKVEIHFVLLNVPDGVTPGSVSYTYGSISPTKNTGNVWHYFDYKPDGYYNVTGASVDVDGTTVSLHNPGTDSGTYNCGTGEQPTPTKTLTKTPTNTPSNTPTNTPTSTSTNTVTPVNTPESEKVTICHAAGQNGSSQYIVLTLNTNAVFNDEGGHFYESGTPQAGHENDFVIESEADLARCAEPTSTPTFTPTQTPTVTPTVEDPFNLIFYCMGFTVVSLNNFESSYEWSISGGPSGTGTVPAFGSVSYDTTYYPGVVTLYSGGILMAAGYLPTDCDESRPSPTPTTPPTSRTPRSNPTEVVRTLIPPVSSTPDILIPVTGVDLGAGNTLQKTLFNLGLLFLGLGLVMRGFSRNRSERDI